MPPRHLPLRGVAIKMLRTKSKRCPVCGRALARRNRAKHPSCVLVNKLSQEGTPQWMRSKDYKRKLRKLRKLFPNATAERLAGVRLDLHMAKDSIPLDGNSVIEIAAIRSTSRSSATP